MLTNTPTSPGALQQTSLSVTNYALVLPFTHIHPLRKRPEPGLARNGFRGWRGEHRELKGPYVHNARTPNNGIKPAQASGAETPLI